MTDTDRYVGIETPTLRQVALYKLAFHDTDILADIVARIVARMSVSVS